MVQANGINERRRREEQFLDFSSAQHIHVDEYVCHVAEIACTYSQEFDSVRTRKLCLGSIIIIYCLCFIGI